MPPISSPMKLELIERHIAYSGQMSRRFQHTWAKQRLLRYVYALHALSLHHGAAVDFECGMTEWLNRIREIPQKY